MTYQIFMLGEKKWNDTSATREQERKRIAAQERHMVKCERCRVAKAFMELKPNGSACTEPNDPGRAGP